MKVKVLYNISSFKEVVFCPIYISTATIISKNYGFVYSSDNTRRTAGRTSGDLYRFSLYSNVVLGYTFIVIMAIAAALNFTITKRYNVLLSGFRGEKSLMKTVKKLGSEYTVFANVPVRYKKNRSEIDLLVMCDRYIIIIEVKTIPVIFTVIIRTKRGRREKSTVTVKPPKQL